MSIVALKLYESLSTKFGADTAETIASFVDEKINEKKLLMETKLFSKIETLATKQDVAELKADLLKWIIGLFITILAALGALIALIKP